MPLQVEYLPRVNEESLDETRSILVFQNSSETNSHLRHTSQPAATRVPAPHLLLHVGNSKCACVCDQVCVWSGVCVWRVGGMINWCTLSRCHQAGTRAHAPKWINNQCAHTNSPYARGGSALRGALRAREATYQMCREIFGRWYKWASHPLIKHPSDPRRERALLIDPLQTVYLLHPWISNKAPNRSRLSSLFSLSILGEHIHTHAHSHARTHTLHLQLPTAPHLPGLDRWIQVIHQTLALRRLVERVIHELGRGGGGGGGIPGSCSRGHVRRCPKSPLWSSSHAPSRRVLCRGGVQKWPRQQHLLSAAPRQLPGAGSGGAMKWYSVFQCTSSYPGLPVAFDPEHRSKSTY